MYLLLVLRAHLNYQKMRVDKDVAYVVAPTYFAELRHLDLGAASRRLKLRTNHP